MACLQIPFYSARLNPNPLAGGSGEKPCGDEPEDAKDRGHPDNVVGPICFVPPSPAHHPNPRTTACATAVASIPDMITPKNLHM